MQVFVMFVVVDIVAYRPNYKLHIDLSSAKQSNIN